MDLIQEYCFHPSSSEEENVHLPLWATEEMNTRKVRKVYLITYSQVNEDRFPTRMSFVEAVLQSFASTPANVIQWCCAEEQHVCAGVHYHMVIKLDRNQRWISSKRFLLETCGISVHFSEIHNNYYSAWKYVTKEDEKYIQSEGHPDLSDTGPPRTGEASIANIARAHKRESCNAGGISGGDGGDGDGGDGDGESDVEEDTPENSKKPRKMRGKAKRKRLTAYELSEIILSKHIKTRTELLAFARQQKVEGKTDIAEFIINRGARVVSDVIENAWEMEESNSTLERESKSRMELLNEASEGECVEGCHGEWLQCANNVLERNGINAQYFVGSVRELLAKGRGKYRNIMIVGPANCGKTFLLNPLNAIFKTFSNPASTSFAWVGAEAAECIFLNDFRWSPSVIQWHDFLLLLEGQLVHLPAPKTHYAKDIVFQKDTPIFATGKNPIIYVRNGAVDEKESEMMMVRWKVFRFHSQIPAEDQKEVPSCGKCFATFILKE